MPMLRAVPLLVLFSLCSLVACQSQTKPNGEPAATAPTEKSGAIDLPGVDTTELTKREKDQWSTYVSELLAPCPDQAVSIARCVTEKRKCDACLPAAQFLAAQVTAGRTRSQAETAYRTRFSADTQKEIAVGGSPTKGPADAPVTIVEWADFECPYCGMASPIVSGMVKRYPGQVRVVFKHFPLPMHEHAESAARAAAAAQLQGKFWEMHDELFKNQRALDDKNIEALAKAIGLDVKKFNEDRRSEAVADAVTADRKQAEKMDLKGTPSIYINGRLFDLKHFDLLENFDPWVMLEIKARTGKEAKPVGGAIKPQPN